MDRDSKGIWLQVFRGRLSFFTLIFLSLFIIIFLSSSMQIILYNRGIKKSLYDWEVNRIRKLQEAGYDYLKKGIDPDIPEPISIYDSQRKLILTNRRSHMRMAEKLMPIRERGGRVLGYIAVKNLPFKAIEENRILLESILKNIVLSTLVSMAVSLLISIIISTSIARSAKGIKKAIGEIRVGKDLDFRPNGPKELIEIGEGIIDLVSKLNREENLRKQWLHDISHDLKTPVTALKIQFESMIHGNLEITKDRIEKNKNEIEVLEELILSINDLMVVESPDLSLNRVEIDTKMLLSDLDSRFKGSTNLKISTTCNNIRGDYNLLFKALSNLIDNGIKYSFGGDWVKVEIAEKSIMVSNPGKPIDDKINIFNRLYRGDLSRSSRGSGIGLSIVKAIVEKHRWNTYVTSENGINTFIINL